MKEPEFSFEPKEHRRNSDPQTSNLAAHQAPSLAKQHALIVLGVLKKNPSGLTSEEISEKCRLRFDQVWRRTSDLERQNLITKTDTARKNSSGRYAVVWRVV